MRLYDIIDAFGGPWGVSAKEFTQVLDSIPDDVNEIQLRINSPGGDVFDGIAILNALRAHDARVVACRRGLAASRRRSSPPAPTSW
jgi:ATP-dependent protease ClpP protease subunit